VGFFLRGEGGVYFWKRPLSFPSLGEALLTDALKKYRDFRWTADLGKNTRGCTLGGNLKFVEGSEIRHFGGLGGPGGPVGHFAGPGGLAPTFLKGLRGPRGAPDPKMTYFRPLKS